MTKADKLSGALHGHTGDVGYDDTGRLYCPVFITAVMEWRWVPIGTARHIDAGVPIPPGYGPDGRQLSPGSCSGKEEE